MNLPNQLTVARLILTFVFVALLSLEDLSWSKTAALFVFAIAAITDFLDGYIARKHNLVTNFGKLMDPLADKVLMCAGFVLLTRLELIPAWIVVVILSREFMVTGLRLLASAEGVVLAAENLGKYKTIFQIVTVIYFLLFLAAKEAYNKIVSLRAENCTDKGLMQRSNPEQRYLVDKLMGGNLCDGKRMPLASTRYLYDPALETVINWVCAGAKNH